MRPRLIIMIPHDKMPGGRLAELVGDELFLSDRVRGLIDMTDVIEIRPTVPEWGAAAERVIVPVDGGLTLEDWRL